MSDRLKKKVIAVIPARFASTRFPGKPLAKIQGKEMILWVIEGAMTAKLVDQVLVATDDERIANVVGQAGYNYVLTDATLPSGTDRIFAAIKSLEFDIVINVQGDEPLITGHLIDQLVRPMLATEVGLAGPEMATLAHAISHSELYSLNAVKVVLDGADQALYFSRFPIPYSRAPVPAEGVVAGVYKHIGMYAYKMDFLRRFCGAPQSSLEVAESLEQLRALTLGARIQVVLVDQPSWGVDTPEDLAKIEEILRTRE